MVKRDTGSNAVVGCTTCQSTVHVVLPRHSEEDEVAFAVSKRCERDAPLFLLSSSLILNMSAVTPFAQRPLGSTLVLFGVVSCSVTRYRTPANFLRRASSCRSLDVDGTLTPARLTAGPEILATLKALRQKAVIGFVGGSDLPKITEQLAVHGQDSASSWERLSAKRWADH